jgi:hypothetical protein
MGMWYDLGNHRNWREKVTAADSMNSNCLLTVKEREAPNVLPDRHGWPETRLCELGKVQEIKSQTFARHRNIIHSPPSLRMASCGLSSATAGTIEFPDRARIIELPASFELTDIPEINQNPIRGSAA